MNHSVVARHNGDEGGRDGVPVHPAAGHVSYATEHLSHISISDESGLTRDGD